MMLNRLFLFDDPFVFGDYVAILPALTVQKTYKAVHRLDTAPGIYFYTSREVPS